LKQNKNNKRTQTKKQNIKKKKNIKTPTQLLDLKLGSDAVTKTQIFYDDFLGRCLEVRSSIEVVIIKVKYRGNG